MKFINCISFPSNDSILSYLEENCFDDYPQKVFLDRGLSNLLLSDITLLYGNNGSGKSTILNLVCEKIKAKRNKPIFKDKKHNAFPFDDMIDEIIISYSDDESGRPIMPPTNRQLVTSDDIFTKMTTDVIHNTVAIHEEEEAVEEFYEYRGAPYSFRSMDDYDDLVNRNKLKNQVLR